MPSLQDYPSEITCLVCEHLSRPDLRSVCLVGRAFNSAAQRVLFRTVFVKVRLPSFERLWSISEHETLRKYVEVIIYDGMEVDWPEQNTFEGWLPHDAARGLGIGERKEFLAQFSEGQLRNYYSNFGHYMRFIQGPVLQGENDERWLREAARKFPRLSTVKYAETEIPFEAGRELKPLNTFSPLAQQILAEPEMGWGRWDNHFWMLVKAMFYPPAQPTIRELYGEMIDLDNTTKWEPVIRQVDMRSLELLSLEFASMFTQTLAPHQALATFLMRAPNLRSLELVLWDYDGPDFDPTSFKQSKFLDYNLYWEHLTDLSLSHMVLSPERLKQLLQLHSGTLRKLGLSYMTLHHGSEPPFGSARALWISMIMFLSESMSLDHVSLVGYFATNTNEAWSTVGRKLTEYIDPPRHEGCLLDRIEHFIIKGGRCPFSPKLDVSSTHDGRTWNPEHSWTWEEDDTWNLATFWIHE
jgi:hypothetical protein